MSVSNQTRRTRDQATREVLSRMQAEIDQSAYEIFNRYLALYAVATPNGLTKTYVKAFERAWLRGKNADGVGCTYLDPREIARLVRPFLGEVARG